MGLIEEALAFSSGICKYFLLGLDVCTNQVCSTRLQRESCIVSAFISNYKYTVSMDAIWIGIAQNSEGIIFLCIFTSKLNQTKTVKLHRITTY